MALVRKEAVESENKGQHAVRNVTTASATIKRESDQNRRRARTMAKQQQAAERIASATAELSSGITEANAASNELSKAMTQISVGAEQASSSAQECLAAINQIASQLKFQMELGERSSEKTRNLQQLVDLVSNNISSLIENVSVAASRQIKSVERMDELEKQAANIVETVQAVIRIADQTNLLALNAAIEAARAGKHGKGFAVVADAVRTLAESSERNANDIREMISEIQTGSREVAQEVGQASEKAQEEIERGKEVTEQLAKIKLDMAGVLDASVTLAEKGRTLMSASTESQRGAEEVAAAAEEQAAACEQAQKAIELQSTALDESARTSEDLEQLSEELRSSSDIAKSSEDVASGAEELSSAIEEIHRSANEIMTAVEQISKGAEQQSAAVKQGLRGIEQIDDGVKEALDSAKSGVEISQNIAELLGQNKSSVDSIITSINETVQVSQTNAQAIAKLVAAGRKIDKTVDAINSVAIQISMLAVSGAVEAARAGEFGKGFAVVSSDIQNLADDAAQNAEQIKDLVRAIQDQMIVVRSDLEETATDSLAESERARKSTEELLNIERDMKEVIAGNQDILTGSEEIVTAVNQSKTGLEQISAAAAQASAASTQAASAAKQQSQSAEELAAAIEEIAAIADELQSGA